MLFFIIVIKSKTTKSLISVLKTRITENDLSINYTNILIINQI